MKSKLFSKSQEMKIGKDVKKEFEEQRNIIGDYFDLQRGTTYKSRLLGQEGPILLGLSTIQKNGGFRNDSLKTYGGESPEKLLVKPGEIYVSLKDITQSADLLGAIARLPFEYPIGRLTQDTVRLKPKSDDVPLDYLYWLMRTPQYRIYCRSYSTGTTNLGLGREDFLAFPAPEPTPKQLKIVQILEVIENKLNVINSINEKLNKIIQTIFKSWFVDFDGVTEFDDSELGPIPKEWKINKLGKIGTIQPGFGFKSKDFTDSGIRIIKIRNIQNSEVNLSFGDFIDNQRFHTIDKKFHLTSGDVVIAMTGAELGKIGIVPQTDRILLLNQRVGKLVSENLSLFYMVLNSDVIQHVLKDIASGSSAQGNISNNDIENMNIVLPNEKIINLFTKIISPLFKKISDNMGSINSITEMKNTLLSKLISGEILV